MFSNLRSLIFKLDPEKAHTLAIKSLKYNFVPNLFKDGKNDTLLKTKLFDKLTSCEKILITEWYNDKNL